MKALYTIVAAAALLIGSVCPAAAGLNTGAKILVHIGAVTSKDVCNQVPSDCHNAVVSAPASGFYNLYLCVGNQSDSVGVAGVQLGITYNANVGEGIDVFSWNRCADLEFNLGDWPGSGSGNMLTWEPTLNCRIGPNMAVIGYLYIGVYSPDRFSITPRPVDMAAKVADCNSAEDDLTNNEPSALGYADFGTGDGYNPCSTIVPVEPMTWSGVKSLFR